MAKKAAHSNLGARERQIMDIVYELGERTGKRFGSNGAERLSEQVCPLDTASEANWSDDLFSSIGRCLVVVAVILITSVAIIKPATIADEADTFRSLANVLLAPGESGLDNVYRPRAKKLIPVKDRYSQLLRNCRYMHTHGLVVIGGDDEAVEGLRSETLDYNSHPDVAWYLPLLIDVTKDSDRFAEKRKFVQQQSWAIPNENELLVVAVDQDGGELGSLVLTSEPDESPQDHTDALAAFLAKHRVEQHDAREKLAGAIAEAKHSGRRVWARVSGTRCGPCIRMSNWLEDNRTAIEKAFVLVEIDPVRDHNGEAVSEQLKHQGGIPWHVMLDDAGQILATSELPVGNIGAPDSTPESLKHLRSMLTAAAGELLTPDDITALLETIK